ncbi:MAG: hypothetical protein ACKO04_00290 [Actinomycetes bacterium]
MTLTRTTAVVTISAVAAYVTGLQKLVLDPVLGWFRDLAPGLQIVVILAVVAGFAALAVVRSRRRRAALDGAVEQVRAFGTAADPAPVTPTPQ